MSLTEDYMTLNRLCTTILKTFLLINADITWSNGVFTLTNTEIVKRMIKIGCTELFGSVHTAQRQMASEIQVRFRVNLCNS